MKLYLDFETIPTSNPAVIADITANIKPPGTIKKAETIAAWEANDKPAAIVEAIAKTSFDGTYGSICSVAYAFDDGPVVSDCSADEEGLITGLYDAIRKGAKLGGDLTVIGHNVVGFDLKFLWKRTVILGIRPAVMPFKAKPWDSAAAFDTMVQWDSDPTKRISLDALCRALGIPSPKGELDGSQIAAAFAAGRYADIAKYNAGDVEAVRRVYRRMTFTQPALAEAA